MQHFKESIKYTSQVCKDPLVVINLNHESRREEKGGEGERSNTQEDGLAGQNVEERGGFQVFRCQIFLCCRQCFLKTFTNFLQGILSQRTLTIFFIVIYVFSIHSMCLSL